MYLYRYIRHTLRRQWGGKTNYILDWWWCSLNWRQHSKPHLNTDKYLVMLQTPDQTTDVLCSESNPYHKSWPMVLEHYKIQHRSFICQFLMWFRSEVFPRHNILMNGWAAVPNGALFTLVCCDVHGTKQNCCMQRYTVSRLSWGECWTEWPHDKS